MITFGGEPNDYWVLNFATSQWLPIVPTGSGPSAIDEVKAAWDNKRHRVIVVDLAREESAGVWALKLDPAPHWSLITTLGTPPSFRGGMSVLYDSMRDRLLVHGGSNGYNEAYGDLWQLPLDETLPGALTWSEIVVPGVLPPGRENHSAVLDVVRDRLVLFGGREGPYGMEFNDTWALRLDGSSSWTRLPSLERWYLGQRLFHSAVFDSSGNRMLVYGGIIENVPEYPIVHDDLVELSFGQPEDPETTGVWTDISPAGETPGPLYGQSVILRSATQEMVLFAGAADYGTERHNEVWSFPLDGAPHWSKPLPESGPPSERIRTATIYDPARQRMTLFGGWNGNPYCDPLYCSLRIYADLWSLDLEGEAYWSRRTQGPTPAARAGHSLIYDPIRDRMLMFGGFSHSSSFYFLDDLWSLALADPGSWSSLSPAGSPPSARSGHSAIYDPIRDRMIVFGGGGGTYTNDLWQLSLGGPLVWTQLSPAGTPPSARVGHVAVYDTFRDRMIVYGGSSDPQTWMLGFEPSLQWTVLPTVGTQPPPMDVRGAIYDPFANRLVVFAGTTNVEVWSPAIGPTPAEWTQLVPAGNPPPAPSSVVYDSRNDRAILFGIAPGNRTWALNWGRMVPTAVALPGPGLALRLDGARPNPARSLTLSFTLSSDDPIRIGVFDLRGRKVLDRRISGLGSGGHLLRIPESDRLPAGVYLVRLSQGEFSDTKRVVLIP